MGRWSAIAIASGTLVGACIDLQAYTCSDDAECTSGGGGRCESTGHCSYPDAECESGQRYGGLAGGFAGQCTDAPAATSDTTDASDEPPVATDTLGGEATSIDSSSSTGGDDTSESTGPDPLPVCGNGVEERGEDCDDGDAEDGDGCNSDCVRGGTPVWEVVVAGDAGGHDRLFGLTQLVAGDLVAVGHMQVTSRDVLVMRFTPDGREVQRVVHDVAGGSDDAEAVTQSALGPLYVCGRATVGGSSRPWAARWNAELSNAMPTHGGPLPMELGGSCYDIAYTNNSEVVAVGGTGGEAWRYTFSEADIGGGVQALASMPGQSFLKEVVRGPGGNIYVGGRLGDLGVVYQPESDMVLGTPLVLTVELAEIQSMAIPGDGSTIFTGGHLHDHPRTNDDFWISAYDLDGAERWRFTADPMGEDEVEDIAVDGAGNVYAIGHTVLDNPNRWVAKLDPEGQLVWQRSDYEGSGGDDRGRSIEVLPDGDLVVVAEITGEDGFLDGWIARLIP